MSSEVDLCRFIREGDTIVWGQAHAEPVSLIHRLVAQRHRIGRMRVFPGIGQSGLLQPEHADSIEFLSYCGTGTNRVLAEAGVLDILPVHYSDLPALIRSGGLRFDVVMLQVSPPDASGRHSLGMAREYLVAALSCARAVIAEVHPDVPWTHGGPYLRAEEFDLLIASDAPPPQAAPARIGPVERAIARHAADLIRDEATLQTGIGAIPDAIATVLHDRRDLGVHSGSIGDGLAELCLSGAVSNRCKGIDPGVSVAGVLIGGEPVRRFAHDNPALRLCGTEYTHAPQVLARLKGFVAINSAVEVDLTGQVNSEVAAGRYVGGVGGIADFLRAARLSEGGVPIVALPSTGGGQSRIVSRLSGPVTVARSDGCVIVTEHGIADLRGRPLSERIPLMLAIADPRHRDSLERAARDHGMWP